MLTIPEVEASAPESMTRAADRLGGLASALDTNIARQQSSLDSLRARWRGSASEAADANARPTLGQLRDIHQSMTKLQFALNNGGTQLVQDKRALLQSVSELKSVGYQVAPDGTVTVKPGSALDNYARVSPVQALQIQHLEVTNSTALKTMLARFDTADRQAGENVRNAVTGLKDQPATFGPGTAPTPQTPPDLASQIPVGKDPKEVKKWWDSLTPEQQQQLIKQFPERIGNLDGIPTVGSDPKHPAGRDAANRAVLQQDLDRVTNAARGHNVSADQVVAHPESYGLTPNDITRYSNANKVQQGLDTAAANTRAPTYLQVYEPDKFDGRGRAAVAIGDPDRAANTTVVVPGTGNSVANGWLSSTDATNLYNDANRADRNNHTAVVEWMGYHAPDSMVDPQVGQTGLAHQGGALLANDVNALNATHEGASHVTVIGHSYGSTTVADGAAGYGMKANDAVLIGCPGTDMAHQASDFHLDGGQVFVGSASSDPVTQFGNISQTHIPGTNITVSLGSDPAESGFGSTRFKAEVPGFDPEFWHDHSHYYDNGSESLFSMADIASGHGDALEQDHMTARHRVPIGIPLANDPETYRRGTSGHVHQ